MALFKRNDNKDQAAEDLAEDLAEGQAEDTSQNAPGTNAEDVPGEDSAPEQAPASRTRFGKPNRKPKPKRNLRGVYASRSWSRRWPTRTSTTSTPTRSYPCICPSAAWSASARRCCAWTSCKRPSWCWRLPLACCSPCRLCRKTWVTSPSTSTAWSCSAAAWPLPTTVILTTPPRAWPPTLG